MKIVDVTTVVVNANLRNWVFVKVTTDEPGLVGWGEASLEWKTRSVVGAVADLAPLLVGQDPLRIEHLWQTMYREPFFKGGAVTMSAISGVDQALHDIWAKHHGVPLYQLLGGAVRDRVRLYDHLGGGSADAVYGTNGATAFAERAEECVKAGFTAVKVLAVPMGNGLPSNAQLAASEAAMGAIRDQVGDDVEIMVDFHGRTTPAAAIQYARVLAPFRPWFIEEPCQPENIDAMLEVTRAVSVPVATGERLFSRYEVRQVLEKRVCAVLQSDVCHAGGVSELRKIAAMASAYDVQMAPHNPLGPVATAVNIHLGLSLSNFLVQEVMRADVPWRDEVVSDALEVVDGHVLPPTRPGIGIEVDERAAARHPYVPEPRLANQDALGAVVDW